MPNPTPIKNNRMVLESLFDIVVSVRDDDPEAPPAEPSLEYSTVVSRHPSPSPSRQQGYGATSCCRASHAKDTKGRVRSRGVESSGDTQAEHGARIGWVDDAVIPQARGAVVGVAFGLVFGQDRRLELLLLGGGPRRATSSPAFLSHGEQRTRRLFPAHDGDTRVRPHPQLARTVRAATHTVVDRAKRPSNDDRELG